MAERKYSSKLPLQQRLERVHLEGFSREGRASGATLPSPGASTQRRISSRRVAALTYFISPHRLRCCKMAWQWPAVWSSAAWARPNCGWDPSRATWRSCAAGTQPKWPARWSSRCTNAVRAKSRGCSAVSAYGPDAPRRGVGGGGCAQAACRTPPWIPNKLWHLATPFQIEAAARVRRPNKVCYDVRRRHLGWGLPQPAAGG